MLKEFLTTNKNLRARETILRHRFIYDVMLAAARSRYHLSVFVSETDVDGYDLILDDGNLARKIQLKTTAGNIEDFKDNGIHVRALIPSPSDARAMGLGFKSIPPWTGYGGAVVLKKLHFNKKEIDVDYYVSDAYIAAAIGFCCNNHPHSRAARGLLKRIQNADSFGRVAVYGRAFLRPNSVDALLCLLGLKSRAANNWITNLVTYMGIKNGTMQEQRRIRLKENFRQNVSRSILELTQR